MQRARIGERAAGNRGAAGEAGGPITHGGSSSGGGEIEQPTEGLPDLARARGCEAEGDAEGAVK